MAQMVATYERDKELNVREAPGDDARVVRTMKPGESAAVSEVRNGWAKLADGYAKAALLVIALGEVAEKAAEKVVEKPEPATEAAEDVPAKGGEPDDDSELRKMTNQQLFDLAAQSGIKVKRGATKAELIAAILDA